MTLPLPPADVDRRKLAITEIRLGALMRIGRAAFPNAVYFGDTPTYRFDAPDGSYGVMYAGFDLVTCVAETLIRAFDNEAERSPLMKRYLIDRIVASFAPANLKLELVDLTVPNLSLGVDGRISTDDNYATTQQWSKAFFHHPQQPDGILFQSRQYPSRRNVAIFNRPHLTKAIKESKRVALGKHPEFRQVLQIPNIEIVGPERS